MTLGPLVLPYPVLLLLLVFAISQGLGHLAERRDSQAGLSSRLANIFLLSLLAARLAFVWRYKELYLAQPWTMLDIRDGGWDQQAGVLAGWVYALVLAYRLPPLRRSLLRTVAVASVLWIGGTLLIMLQASRHAPAPGAVLQDRSGAPVALSAFRGKPTVINLWASWCPPCRREMPAMAAFQRAHPEVHMVFVNQGEAPGVVADFLAAGRLELDNVLLDQARRVARDYDVAGYPTTLFFDAQGRLQFMHTGELSQAALAARVAQVRQAAPAMP